MSLLEQVLDIVALRQGKGASPGTRNQRSERPAQTEITLQHAWVVEISLTTLKAGKSINEDLRTAGIYELGKRDGEQWELIDQRRCEVRGDAEDFCLGFLSMMTRLGMKKGDLIIVLANEQYYIDCAVRAIWITSPSGARAHKASSEAGVVLPPPAGDDSTLFIEQREIDEALAAVRRVKIIEYLKNHLT